MIDSKFPYDNHHQHAHTPSIAFNHEETAPIEQLRPVSNGASLLASVMVEQPIIQAVISSVESLMALKVKLSHGYIWLKMQHKF